MKDNKYITQRFIELKFKFYKFLFTGHFNTYFTFYSSSNFHKFLFSYFSVLPLQEMNMFSCVGPKIWAVRQPPALTSALSLFGGKVLKRARTSTVLHIEFSTISLWYYMCICHLLFNRRKDI